MARIVRLTVAALAAAVLLLGAGRPASGGEEPATAEEPDWSFDAEVAAQSRYVFRGAVLFDGPVLQPAVRLGWRGLTVGLWGSLELDDGADNAGEFTEVDYTAEYGRDFGPASLAAGVAHYRFPNTDCQPTTEVYLSAGLDWTVSPSLAVYRDVDQTEGVYVSLALGWTAEDLWEPLPGMRVSLDLRGSVGWGSRRGNLGLFGYAHDALADATLVAGAPLRLGERWTLTPSLSCSTLLDRGLRAQAEDDDNLWAGLTLSVSF